VLLGEIEEAVVDGDVRAELGRPAEREQAVGNEAPRRAPVVGIVMDTDCSP
jgi:hypothetical protein